MQNAKRRFGCASILCASILPASPAGSAARCDAAGKARSSRLANRRSWTCTSSVDKRAARSTITCFIRRGFLLAAASVILCVNAATGAAALRIVAVGAGNTSGWLIAGPLAYPAVLERMFRAKGVDAQVTNAGVPFDTTSRMLARLDAAVPDGTDIVILQPGGNDLRFLGSKQQRTANIEAMAQLLQTRSIAVIIHDEEIPWRHVFDAIHLTAGGTP
jgi:acyl-CoA thioesterase I